MISLKKFINDTKGQRVDVPWANGALKGQCVSLVQQYVGQCLGQPMKARGNAVDWDESYVREGLGQRTSNPRYGDLIVFNPPYAGTYGHIAIYINNTTMYDQNNASHDGRCAGYGKLFNGGVYIRPNANLIPDEPDTAGGFLGSKGYFSFGDNHVNIGKIASFMRNTFPIYTDARALGNYYGQYIKASITEFQRRAHEEGKYNAEIDGNIGPKTLASLKKYGFKE